jgi:hypothetical protein
MKQRIHFALLSLWLVAATIACTPGSESNGKGTGGDPWPEITEVAKPWARWWWLGSDVDRENIDALMKMYAESGLGGMEITPIYGVQGREQHYISYLSPEWMEMLRECVTGAHRNGMGVDMNLGTGWPFGGPQITPGDAAGKLVIRTYSVSGPADVPRKVLPEAADAGKLGARLEALMAWPEAGSPVDLTSQVDGDGTLDWEPGDGHWLLVAAFCGKTGQMVKRAAPGGEGLTMDHFSEHALDTYLSRFQEAFGGDPGVRCFFNDSYEVYNASWTPGFFDIFMEKRGYDLRPYLREFTGNGGQNDTAMTARLKSDYRETMSELLLENFTRPWTAWSHEQGALTRNQAHGSPGNLIDLYAAVDIPECEIYGHRTFDIPGMRPNEDDKRNVEPNPMMLKLATSAAHITGKPLVSNETFTWLGEHFKVALSQCKPEVEEAFLAGINHVFYHGIPYSPLEASWPGWLFYASVHFGPTNSFWPHLEGLNGYIARCQSLLQSGRPDNEALVYWPVHDLWHDARGMEMMLTVHNIEEWLVYPGMEKMAAGGTSYDFISDALLQQLETKEGRLVSAEGSVSHAVLVIPACRFMPLATLQKITGLAREGGVVVFEKLPEDVPGWNDLDSRRKTMGAILSSMEFKQVEPGLGEWRTGKGSILLCGDPGNALEYAGIGRERISDLGLKYIRRSMEDGRLYYLVNHQAVPVDTLVPLNTPARSVLIMDPLSGGSGAAVMEQSAGQVKVKVQLQPGESVFIRTYNRAYRASPWPYEKKRDSPEEVNGRWTLRFDRGGPRIPDPVELDSPVPWTSLKDSIMQAYSGQATYSVTFTHHGESDREYLLRLGKVYESARVRLNGTDLGPFWCIPFEKRVGHLLNEGENQLEIEVANLMANRIRSMDRQGIPWRIFHEINFVNIAYEPFDASLWQVEPSGLEGPVELVPLELDK